MQLSFSDHLLWKVGPAARALGISVDDLQAMVEAGTVPVVTLPGGHCRFSPLALSAWVKERTQKPVAGA